ANHVILLDIPWNPAVEEQAIGRAYRRGQLKDVHVYKLIATFVKKQTVNISTNWHRGANETIDEVNNLCKIILNYTGNIEETKVETTISTRFLQPREGKLIDIALK